MNWMLLPLKRYADFTGRSRRKEYWMYFLLNTIIGGTLGVVLIASVIAADPEASGFPPLGGIALILLLLWTLGTMIPNIAVHVRRFHDQDKSGWMYLISFVPYIGGLIVLVFMCLPGTQGANRFGGDPKASETLGEVFA